MRSIFRLSTLPILMYVIILILFPASLSIHAADTPPDNLHAKAAIIMDGSNQRVLFGKEEREVLPMASTTKIMTCLYALEHGNLNDVVTISKRAASAPKVHLGVKEGDRFLLSDLLHSLMMESHNDSAIAIAEHISGSVEDFCKDMTEKAHAYGCYDTSFATPNGLDDPEHFTTCYDLAIIACHALRNPTFRQIIKESSYSIREMNSGTIHNLSNKNAFLSSYKNAIGIKTGYTSGAGYCFVGAVENEKGLFLSVVLGSGWYPHRTWKWDDTRALMDYATQNYEKKDISFTSYMVPSLSVSHGQKDKVNLIWPEQISLLLNQEEQVDISVDLPDSLEAPLLKNDMVGSLTVSIDGTKYRTFPILLADSIKEETYLWCLKNIWKQFLSITVKRADIACNDIRPWINHLL